MLDGAPATLIDDFAALDPQRFPLRAAPTRRGMRGGRGGAHRRRRGPHRQPARQPPPAGLLPAARRWPSPKRWPRKRGRSSSGTRADLRTGGGSWRGPGGGAGGAGRRRRGDAPGRPRPAHPAGQPGLRRGLRASRPATCWGATSATVGAAGGADLRRSRRLRAPGGRHRRPTREPRFSADVRQRWPQERDLALYDGARARPGRAGAGAPLRPAGRDPGAGGGAAARGAPAGAGGGGGPRGAAAGRPAAPRRARGAGLRRRRPLPAGAPGGGRLLRLARARPRAC